MVKNKGGQSRRFIKNSIIFLIGSTLSKVVTFFLLPLYTKYIPPDAFGYYDLSITYSTVATSLLFFDIWITTMRYMYDEDNIKWRHKVVASGYSIFTASSLLMLLAYVILSYAIEIKYIFLIFGYAISLNLHNMFTYPARGFGRNLEFAISGILNTLVNVLSNIVLIIWLNVDFSALYISAIIGNIAQSLYLEMKIGIVRNIGIKKLDFSLVKKMLIYTLPLSINSVAYWLLTGFNKIIINNVLTAEYNGYYAIGHKFGYAITLVTSCFTFAWQDLSFSRSADDESNGKYYSKACRLYMLFLGLGIVVMMPGFNVIFPLFVDESYAIAKTTIPLFLITATISAYSNFIGNIFYALKDTKTLFISMIVSCLVNLGLCYPFILLWGLNGANLSIIISFIINIAIRSVILNKKIRFSLDIKLLLLIASGILMTLAVYYRGNSILNIIWFVIVVALSAFILRDYIKTILLGFFKRKKDMPR